MRKLFTYLPVIAAFIFFSSCKKEKSIEDGTGNYTLNIHFQNYANGLPVALNTDSYINDFGEVFIINKLKYYISNIQLRETGTNNVVSVPDSYFLVDESADTSKTISVRLPSGKFDRVSFLIGVDSARNVSGAQTGALDPLYDMFWTWNSGYIQFKMEGTSPMSTAVNNKITYHIGGFRTGENTIRMIDLDLPASKLLDIKNFNSSLVTVGVDVDKVFNSVHPLEIVSTPTITTPGNLAVQFADNYKEMFFVFDVVNN